MSEPGGWSTPDGWGAPASPPPTQPAPPAWGSQPGQPAWDRPPPGQRPRPARAVRPAPQAPWGSRPVDDKPGVIPLRPLGLGEVLDGAVGVLRRYPRPALGLAALVALVSTLCNVLLLVTAFEPFLTVDSTALEDGDTAALEDALGGAVAGASLSLLLSLVSGAVLTGAMTAVVGKAVLGEPVTFGQAWAQVRSRLLPLDRAGAARPASIVAGTFVGATVAGVAVIAVARRRGRARRRAAGARRCGGRRLALRPAEPGAVRAGARAHGHRREPAPLERARAARLVAGVRHPAADRRHRHASSRRSCSCPSPRSAPARSAASSTPTTDVLGTRSLVMTAVGGGLAATLVAPFTAGVRALLYVDRRMRAEGLDVSLSAAAASRT